MSNNLKFRLLGNSEIMGKTQKLVEAEPNSQPPFYKKKLAPMFKNYTKADIKVSRPAFLDSLTLLHQACPRLVEINWLQQLPLQWHDAYIYLSKNNI